MKILQLDYDDLSNPYAAGGQAKATFSIYSHLARKHSEIKVTVVTGNYRGATNKKINGIDYKRLGFKKFGHFVSILSYWALLPFYVLFNSHKYDIVVESFTAPFSTSFVPVVSSKPVIGVATFFNAEELCKKYYIPFQIIQNCLLLFYKDVIILSKSIEKKLLSINPKLNLTIVPRGIENEYFNIRSVDGKYFLYIGRLDIYQKGLDLLINIWAILSKENTNIKLYIAGGGTKKDVLALQDQLKKNNLLDKTVFFKGRVTGEAKKRLIQHAKAVIYLSRYETFGNVALEAFAAGKIFICSDIKGYSWFDKSVALKHDLKDVDGIVSTIKDVNVNQIKYRKTELKARIFAKSFLWEEIATQFYKCLLNVV